MVLWREPARAALSAARHVVRVPDAEGYFSRLDCAVDAGALVAVRAGASSAAATSCWRAIRSRNADALFEQLLCPGSDSDAASHVRSRRGAAGGHGSRPGSVPRIEGAFRLGSSDRGHGRERDEARARAAPPGAAGTAYWEKSLDALAPTEAADYATDAASTRAEIKKLTAELNEIGELLNQIAEVTEPDLFARGVAKHEAGDRDGAAEAWLAYLESTEDCGGRAADAHYNLGVYFDARGELEMAGRMYAGALTCAPSHESALQNAGANAINRGDAVSAVEFDERAYAR